LIRPRVIVVYRFCSIFQTHKLDLCNSFQVDEQDLFFAQQSKGTPRNTSQDVDNL
jgi:hypothetical protein